MRHNFAKSSELNWDVVKSPIVVNGKEVDSHFALTRSDNNNVLQIHRESYNPFPNKDFRNLMDDMQKITGFENMPYQEYKEGKVVLGYLENTKNVKVNGFDTNNFMVIGNSHDGSKGIFLGTSEVMLRCMNEFGKIVNNNIIRHTKNNSSKIDDLKLAYERYFMELERMDMFYKKMHNVKISQDLLDSLTNRLFDVSNNEEISTRKSNQIFDFKSSVSKETADLGMTGFGFFNATTHYTTHVMKGENVLGNMFGQAAKMNNRSLELILELC